MDAVDINGYQVGLVFFVLILCILAVFQKNLYIDLEEHIVV